MEEWEWGTITAEAMVLLMAWGVMVSTEVQFMLVSIYRTDNLKFMYYYLLH